jgi:MarR family transcriptional regulator, organic hydroperoxide resistance regulator
MDELRQLSLGVKALQRAIEQSVNDAMKPLGLTAAQADALTVLRQTGAISLRELGELLIAEGGHPSRLVDRLVAAGLVERQPGAEDRRRIVLSLTRKGRELERQADKIRQSQLELLREMLGGRDPSPALELISGLLEQTAFADLMSRRRALLEGNQSERRT